MSWLVTGGAGYIGSHVVRAFSGEGIPAAVIDDLSTGHRSFVRDDIPFYEGSVLQRELLDQIFTENSISGVVHLAGLLEGCEEPAWAGRLPPVESRCRARPALQEPAAPR